MTMQIAMVGTDGIVLASDTRRMNTDSGARHTSNVSKIRINHERGVAISCARSLELACRIADDLIAELDEQNWLYPNDRAAAIANNALNLSKDGRSDFQCLIVATKPILQLFHLHSGIFNLQKGARCDKEARMQIAGDNVNPAVFWPERYYQRLPLQPIRQLVPLAAHFIVAASKLNPLAIEGLEIVLCCASGVHRLSDDSIRELESKADEWDRQIGTFFATHAQELTYAPIDAG